MATSVVCDNAAVRGFELLKLSGNAEIDGEREEETGRVRPSEGCVRACVRVGVRACVCALVMRTHTVTIPLRERWKFMTFQLGVYFLRRLFKSIRRQNPAPN